MRDKPHTKHEVRKGNDNSHIEKETSGKRKVGKSKLIGQNEEELKKGKDVWDVTLNVPTGDKTLGVISSMKLSWMH
jgi:hypothetical protein